VREWIGRIADSVAGVFTLETDPALSEAENVEKLISETGLVAGLAVCIQPIPLADVLLLAPLYAKLTLHVGRIKGFELGHERALEIAREVAGAASLALASQLAIGAVGKLLPPLRPVLVFPLTYGATYAIGKGVDHYFDCLRDGTIPSTDALRAVFEEQFEVGKRRGQAFDAGSVRSRADALREKVRARDPELVTRTRLEPLREEAGEPAPRAPAAEVAAPRRKIRITPDDVARRQAEAREPEAAPAAPKTLGPVAGPPEVQIGFRNPPKTLGDAGEDDRRAPGEPTPDVAPGLRDAPALGAEPPGAAPASREADAAADPPPLRIEVRAPADGRGGLLERLERLAALRAEGALTPEEFAQAKQRLLGD